MDLMLAEYFTLKDVSALMCYSNVTASMIQVKGVIARSLLEHLSIFTVGFLHLLRQPQTLL